MSDHPPTLITHNSSLITHLRDWAQLCRLPYVFTATADSLAGALVVGAGLGDTGKIFVILLASACFYAGGAVLNDWNDYRRDLVECPQRPLPAKRIARWRALIAAAMLLSAGQLLASALDPATGGVGLLLLVCIILYDVLMRDLPVAPALMGAARSLNLLMGMSAVGGGTEIVAGGAGVPPASGWLQAYIAFGLGLYVLGITVFARGEAGRLRKDQLVLGAAFAAAAVLMLVLMHVFFPDQVSSSAAMLWPALLAGAAGYYMVQAVLTPTPVRIRRAVQVAGLGIILFDAGLVASRVGLLLSLLVVVLLAPAIWFERTQ